ncbi:MAG: methonine synthase [Methanocellales archaeon]|nr:methonine synthase [Methanocellales archaeon]
MMNRGDDPKMDFIASDDIGSFPLPKSLTRQDIGKMVINDHDQYERLVQDVMRMKMLSGVDVLTYPQLQNMISQFLYPITNPKNWVDKPLMIKEDKANIHELSAIEHVAKEHHDSSGKALGIKVCITGPVELHIRGYGHVIHVDVLESLAKSLSNFVKNGILRKKHLETRVISIDEPSLGVDPQLIIEDDELLMALEKVSNPAKGMDVQIHLHSPLETEKIYGVDGINIVGVESASTPSSLDVISKKDLDKYDKFLRVGIARTDIDAMAAGYRDATGIDIWRDTCKALQMIDETENVNIIKRRLEIAYQKFGNRIKYSGPDCGLGGFIHQEAALKLLKNAAMAVSSFNAGVDV